MKLEIRTVCEEVNLKRSNSIRLATVSQLFAVVLLVNAVVFASDQGAHFIHLATVDNTGGNATVIDHTLANSNSSAIVHVTKNWSPPGGLGPYNAEPIGVYYNEAENKWAIFNEDVAADIAVDAGFNVWIPPVDSSTFVHTADASNTSDWVTGIDNPLTNNNSSAVLLVTQCWNPGGGIGVYNNQVIGVWYNDVVDQWTIYNQDGATPVPLGASFNVTLLSAGPAVAVHTATPANITGQITEIDHPLTNNNPYVIVSVTQRFNVAGGSGGVYNDHAIGVYYNSTGNKWAIFNEDLTTMPSGAVFNVSLPRGDWATVVHTADVSNISGHISSINHALTNNNANALVFVTQNWNPGDSGHVYNNHEIGVYYSSSANKWMIFNQDSAAMPDGASFNLAIPEITGITFVHTSTVGNSSGNATKIHHLLTNNEPDAIVHITQNWNPSGAGGEIYNDHPTGVYYNDTANQWSVFNEDFAAMPEGAAFNVWIPPVNSSTFVHTATVSNTDSNWTWFEHPSINLKPNAIVYVTQNWNPGGGLGVYNPRSIGVFYATSIGKWAVFNQDSAAMPDGASFNITVLAPLFADGFESGDTSAWSVSVP